MPFTFAHPAAVVPLARWLWLPGLVAGSLAPDVAYYLPVPGGALTHEPVGLVSVDLLLGLVLVAAGYAVLAPVLAFAPAGWRERVPRPAGRVPWLGSVVSVVVGAATHLLWDAFTHTGGFAVRHWRWLRVSVAGPHRLYNVIGYVSSAGGLFLLAVLVVRWYRRAPRADRTWPALPRAGRTVVAAGLGAGLVVGALLGLTDPVSRVSGYDWVRCLLIGAVRGGALAAAGYVVAWPLISRRIRSEVQHEPR
ncbi:DUF4184 family protein [Amycolatopsis sp. DG1A-15b]|uniref:DUF4184 family protein n=1 Tax=Amycolatopsis sp. DG1A-15b TaxID=3052846 RepID=UPI00255BFC22|nr:DUF4184 family protein [Amycolatopsis sp. DG1A-15b]WIX92799.1 DUF4184 family protein [Amycolatopsis sp. DG1A-15b]